MYLLYKVAPPKTRILTYKDSSFETQNLGDWTRASKPGYFCVDQVAAVLFVAELDERRGNLKMARLRLDCWSVWHNEAHHSKLNGLRIYKFVNLQFFFLHLKNLGPSGGTSLINLFSN
jgi:hypothetical protein